jgi:hypothetical protein
MQIRQIRRWRHQATFALIAIVLASLPGTAHAATRGAFVVDCRYSHTLQVDPIVAPGVSPFGHLHDFFGNRSTDASSTQDSMADASSTCEDWDDTAAYWSPTGYLNGVQLTPVRQRIYYFGETGRSVQTIPAGLKMIAGNHDATSAAENPVVSWNCGGSTPSAGHPYDCTPYRGTGNQTIDGVVGYVDFPQCWDGVHLDSPDHVSHMAYETASGCPAGDPVYLPRLRLRVHFGIWDPCAGARPCGPADPDTNVALSLSSGPYYTLHADFWNTWRQPALDALVAECLNGHVACGEPDPFTPSAPAASAGTEEDVVHLSWLPPTDGGAISGYEIYRGSAPGTETEIASVDAGTTYDDTQVATGSTFYYTVAAENAYGSGQWSEEIAATPGADAAPGTPLLSASTAGGIGVKLKWTQPTSDGGSAITAYRVYRGRSPGSETLLSTTGNVTTYRDTSTRHGASYVYRISAVNGVGEGPLSNEASATAA